MPSSVAVAHVDVVVADRHVADDAQRAGARLQHRGVDAVGEHADDRVDAHDRGAQLVGGERGVVGALDDLGPGGDERVEARREGAAG